ncbi:hypothetical protein AVEN_21231-1 [Araneus ventricosus]|uniref:Uncharacterized protein n=1 Tax=Araneus ventricosus TaxID=182803 RepID=A0A4Y2LMG0_ARAVE|nr:hypothetical protein AVEN_21231-1 [Araneus ventricosus]
MNLFGNVSVGRNFVDYLSRTRILNLLSGRGDLVIRCRPGSRRFQIRNPIPLKNRRVCGPRGDLVDCNNLFQACTLAVSNLLQACRFAEQDCCKLKLLSGTVDVALLH